MSDEATSFQLTADIVAAYLEANTVSVADLPALISSVHRALGGLSDPVAEPAKTIRTTPLQIRRSVTPEALISFEDGKPYKHLKRHLAKRGLTPEAYREKWGLPTDYPMVTTAYSTLRSEYAKATGLGSRVKAKPAPASVSPPTPEPPKARLKGRLGLFKKREP